MVVRQYKAKGELTSLLLPIVALDDAVGLVLFAVSFGIARVIGNFGGGLLADAIGMQKVFFVSAGICVVTSLIFAPYYIRRAPMNGES